MTGEFRFRWLDSGAEPQAFGAHNVHTIAGGSYKGAKAGVFQVIHSSGHLRRMARAKTVVAKSQPKPPWAFALSGDALELGVDCLHSFDQHQRRLKWTECPPSLTPFSSKPSVKRRTRSLVPSILWNCAGPSSQTCLPTPLASTSIGRI